MDGIHDCGGMQGFGSVIRETDEPVFHHPWEKRVFALTMAAPFVTEFDDDQFRKHIERIPTSQYTASSYYELWLEGLIRQLREMDVVDDVELETGHSMNCLPEKFDTKNQAQESELESIVNSGLSKAMPFSSEYPHRFSVGDQVKTRSHMTRSHNRLPRYARGKTGVIVAENGYFIFADSNADRSEADPQMLYTVEFEGEELWGIDAEIGTSLHLDLWDAYLEEI